MLLVKGNCVLVLSVLLLERCDVLLESANLVLGRSVMFLERCDFFSCKRQLCACA